MKYVKRALNLWVWFCFIYTTYKAIVGTFEWFEWQSFLQGRNCASITSPYTFFQEDPTKGYVSDIGKLFAMNDVSLYVCSTADRQYMIVAR